jgi:hypothetical protein
MWGMIVKEEAMRVKVSDIDGIHATTYQAGQKLYTLIAPVLARGEPVELDFEGVRHFSPLFFNASIGILVEADKENRLPERLRVVNLPPLGQDALDSVIDYAIRCRDNPRWAEAMDQAVRKWSQRE